MAAATQPSSPPPNLFNVVEQNNNHHKQHKTKHGELEEEQQDQEVVEYSHHYDDGQLQPSCNSSPTSISSSPSHEFSFTVYSLYSTSSTTTAYHSDFRERINNSSVSLAGATAIDLSPADEIFLHGHLLPLHVLSGGHLSNSPRSSTNSLDGVTLPISFSNPSNLDSSMDQDSYDRALDNNMEKHKSRSFSLFRNRTTALKSRKLPRNQETAAENKSSKPHQADDDESQNHHNHKNLNKVKFDLSNAIKQYAKLVRPLLTFKHGNSISSSTSRRESRIQLRGQTFSYSGNLSGQRSNKQRADDEVLRGRFSAPASMKASPTNSAMFLEASRSNNSSSSSDSTMEELQAAIQAAITHCKNSYIASTVVQDKIY